MPDNRPLTLTTASSSDFITLNRVLCVLALVAALLSPFPVAMTLVSISLIGTAWFFGILRFSKVNTVELTLIIFTDGQVRLDSNCKNIAGGVMDGQQWCTRHLAVLRIISGDEVQNLLVLPRQQTADEYRRLSVWLRHRSFAIKSEGRV